MAMKLYYFNMKGRAETPRLVMQLGGTKFEDVRFSGEEWGTKYKAMSPTGQCPWLEFEDGSKITQSTAISVYCAAESGMLPSKPYDVARTLELTNALEELFTPLTKTFAIKDADEKIAARKALIESEGAVTKKMNIVESIVAAAKGEFFCGDKPSLADIHMFCFLGSLRSGFIDGIDAEYIDSFKNLSALRSKVAGLPEVAKLYDGEAGYEA